MYAYSNILAALIQRERTGYGSRVEISMLEAMSEWMGYPLYYTYKGAPQPERTGAFHATIYPYGPFKAGDDSVVMLGLQNEREWVAFCRHVLNRPDLAEDPRFASNSLRTEQRFELQQIIDVAFSKLTGEGVIDRLNAAGIACARVNSMHDLWDHPQLKARERWREVDSPEGRVPALIPPGLPSSVSPRMDPIPSLGEHSKSILNDLGFNEQQIAAMKSNGTI